MQDIFTDTKFHSEHQIIFLLHVLGPFWSARNIQPDALLQIVSKICQVLKDLKREGGSVLVLVLNVLPYT